MVWYSHLFQNFPQFIVVHTVKGFGIVNKAEIDVFLELSCFFMIQWMLAIWSLVPLPFLKPAWTSGSFTVHVLLKPSLENFEHYFTRVWDECNCAVVWAFFDNGILLSLKKRGSCNTWHPRWTTVLSSLNLFPRWILSASLGRACVFTLALPWVTLIISHSELWRWILNYSPFPLGLGPGSECVILKVPSSNSVLNAALNY